MVAGTKRMGGGGGRPRNAPSLNEREIDVWLGCVESWGRQRQEICRHVNVGGILIFAAIALASYMYMYIQSFHVMTL